MSQPSGRHETGEVSVSVGELLFRHGGGGVNVQRARADNPWGANESDGRGGSSGSANSNETGDGGGLLAGRWGPRNRKGIVTAACVVLCGVVAVSAGALVGPRVERPQPDVPAVPGRISGSEVLRPDRISEMLRLAAATRTLAGRLAPDSIEPDVDPEELSAEADGSGPALEPVTEPVRDPVLNTVTEFYESVATAPSDAFELLAGQMRGSGYPDFRSSWSGVLQVTINGVRRVGPDAAVVAVRLDRAQAPQLRTLQRLVVGERGRIRDATLLAAAVPGA